MKDQTIAINSCRPDNEINDRKVNTINPPVHNGSTILFETYEDLSLANQGKYSGLTYGTDRLPVQRAFEETLCQMEGGHICRVFQSGINAIIHTLQAFTKAGDHIVICDNVYWPTANFSNKILTRFGIEITYAPSAVGSDIVDYVQENTVLIFLESPGSNSFEIQDIEPITEIAHKRGIITVMDATWATPLYHKPLNFGIDVSIQSVTKYISGHSDVLLGSVTVNERYSAVFKEYYKTLELFASPQDCYNALKGLKTLKVRLKQHEQSGLTIAKWLEDHPLVGKVIHPAFSTHPQHDRWKKYFSGSSGLFAFIFKDEPTSEQLAHFINSLKLFGIGYSWGGYKSLVTAGKYKRINGSEFEGKTIVRLNIGLEETEDLLHDLNDALALLKNK